MDTFISTDLGHDSGSGSGRIHNLDLAGSTKSTGYLAGSALRRLWRRSITTCCLLQTLANWPLSVYSTLQRRSTLSTMTYYCFGWNGSSVSEELRSSGFAPTFPVGLYSNQTSFAVYIVCSVPQGSVLGPRLFILHSGPCWRSGATPSECLRRRHSAVSALSSRRYNCCCHTTGDLLKPCQPPSNCRYSSEAQLGSSGLSVQFGGEFTSASDHVRVLGVTMSSDLSLEKHVANVCSSGFYRLRQLRRVRRSIDTWLHEDARPCLRHVACGLL